MALTVLTDHQIQASATTQPLSFATQTADVDIVNLNNLTPGPIEIPASGIVFPYVYALPVYGTGPQP